MKKITIPNKMSRKLHKVGFQIKKYSPEILIAAGVVGVGTSMVMACKATLQVNDILEEAKSDLETIKTHVEKPENEDRYTESEKQKAVTMVYGKAGLKLAKLYGPSVALCTVSLGCIIKSHNIMHKRNVALAAAYTAVDKGFKEYRGRVIDRFGKELDRELRYNIKAKEVEETVVDEKTGEKKVVKKTVEVVDPNSRSPYAIIYDDGNTGWSKDPEANKFFLLQQQRYANDKLKAKGYLYLNEVYEMLGAPLTKAGHVVGWIYDEENPVGDNFVDFGIFNIDDPNARRFVNGYERNCLLDFNVDGNIWELM